MRNRLIFWLVAVAIVAVVFYSFRSYLPVKPATYLAKIYGDPTTNSVSKKIGELECKLKIIPAEALALRSIQPKITKTAYQTAVKDYARTVNFVFSIQGGKGVDILKALADSSNEYEDLIRYFAFDCKNDFLLYNQNDTLLCSFTHFERTFNLDAKITVSGTFVIPADCSLGNENIPFTVGYNGEILNLAFINFYFDPSDLLAKPNLIF